MVICINNIAGWTSSNCSNCGLVTCVVVVMQEGREGVDVQGLSEGVRECYVRAVQGQVSSTEGKKKEK